AFVDLVRQARQRTTLRSINDLFILQARGPGETGIPNIGQLVGLEGSNCGTLFAQARASQSPQLRRASLGLFLQACRGYPVFQAFDQARTFRGELANRSRQLAFKLVSALGFAASEFQVESGVLVGGCLALVFERR